MTRTALAAVALSLALSGCRTLDVRYGLAHGPSINGTSAFREILESADHQVDAWPFMTQRVEQGYDVVILFHDDFMELPYLTHESLRASLLQRKLRALVIIPRDSDAAIQYWEYLLTTDLSKKERERAESALRMARDELEIGTSTGLSPMAGVWYGMDVVDRDATSEELAVTISDAQQSDPTVAARWPLHRRLVPLEQAEALWQAGDDVLLAAEQRGDVTIYVMASAYPLLNGGLVDPGNRVLAEDLVVRLGESGRIALVTSSLWLESQPESASLWSFLRVQPYPWIFGHLLAAILLFCWWKLPIFGRPQVEVVRETKRFGRHVEALGDLLARSSKPRYSVKVIHEWQQSQKSHRSTLKEN